MVWPFSPPSGSRGRARPEPFYQRMARFLRRLLLVCLAFALLSLGSYCVWSLNRFIKQSGYFTIQERIVNSGLSADLDQDARDFLNRTIVPGSNNLYLLNKSLLEKRLGALPRVKKVAVVKDYPNTLKVTLTERIPVAIAKLEDSYLIDNEGVLLDKVEPGANQPHHMPVLNGLHARDSHAGNRITQKGLHEVLVAIAYIHDKEVMLDRMIDEWNIENPEQVMAMLNTHAQVIFGAQPPIDNVPKLITGLLREKESENAKVIDLRWGKQYVYRFN